MSFHSVVRRGNPRYSNNRLTRCFSSISGANSRPSPDLSFRQLSSRPHSNRHHSFLPKSARGLCFSTAGSTTSNNEAHSSDEEIQIRESITHLLQDEQTYPPGSLSQELLQDAEEALESWVSERNRVGLERASTILTRLVQEQEVLERSVDHPNESELQNLYHVRPFLLNQVVDCWRTCWRDELVDIAPSEILSMVDDLENRGLEPDSRTLTLIVDGMILRGDHFEAPLLAQWLLDRRMEQASEEPSMRPDTVLITNVIRAWAKSGRLEAPEMAEGLLQLMHDLYESGWTESGPNSYSYAATMEAWYCSRHHNASQAMEQLLENMKHSCVEQVTPNRVAYTYMINGWADARSSVGPQKAYNLLQEMLQLYEAGNEEVTPSASNFSKVMTALAQRGDPHKVEVVFEQLQDLYSKTCDAKFLPNDACWKAMIIAFAKRGSPSEAQDILDELVARATAEQDPSLMPKRGYFVDTLVAWAKLENRRMASKKSEQVLMRLLELSKAGFPELTPNSKCFEKVMQTWSKNRDEESAKKIESLLRLMDQLHTETGNEEVKSTGKAIELAALAWSRSDQYDAPERAEALIREMENRYAAGNTTMKPRRGVYTTLMVTWLRSGREDAHSKVLEIFIHLKKMFSQGHSHLRPDLYIFSVVMDSWAQRGNAVETQAVFDAMVEEYSQGNKEAKPDVHAFNKILKAWVFSRDKDRVQKAETTLQKLKDFGQMGELKLSPNRQTFNEMISVWSGIYDPTAAEMSESYLRQLQENNFDPTIISYRAAIDAWTKNKDPGAPARAEDLLEELLHDVASKRVRLPFPKPYRKFLLSIARSKIPGRNRQARELLDSLPQDKVLSSLLPPL